MAFYYYYYYYDDDYGSISISIIITVLILITSHHGGAWRHDGPVGVEGLGDQALRGTCPYVDGMAVLWDTSLCAMRLA